MPTPPYASIVVEAAGTHVVRIVLDRPHRLNALTWEMIDELRSAVDDVGRSEVCRVVIITGRGRAFSSGLDLKKGPDPLGSDLGVVAGHRRQSRLSGLVLALRDLPQPVIAAVRGPVAGGGLSLALASDLRLCSDDAAFDAGFTRIGLSGGDAGVSALLPRIVGHGAAADILLAARRVGAPEALRLGLASEVVQAEDLDAAVNARADQIAALAPYGVSMTKQLLHRAGDGTPLRTVLDLEDRTQVLAAHSEDAREGLAAFHDRRPPTFRGR